MSKSVSKWDTVKQNHDDPLYVVLFTSRNKDNKAVEGFHERRKAFLHHLSSPVEIDDNLKSSFLYFVRTGKDDETSRMYVSLNARDPEKIKKELMHQLIDDQLGGNDPLTHMDTVVASIAARKECSAENKWFFDFDEHDSEKVDRFSQEINQIVDNEFMPVVHETPHGYAVICDHGFDIRKLSNEFQNMMENGIITLKRDDLLCVDWYVNDYIFRVATYKMHSH